ncbi:MAG: hypothetical protein ABWZ98_07565, partial [Nakamurella sp.]
GGQTNIENNGPLCRRHHLFKHHTEWSCRPDPDRTVLYWASPTGHHYTKHGPQAVPPRLWVSTSGTAVAERLDNTALAIADWVDGPPVPGGQGSEASGGVLEELLASLVLKVELNKPPLEYEHLEGAWNISAVNDAENAGSELDPSDCTADGDRDDELPPF